ncbi:unnamed protein product [Cylicocyclus nassatus]|uniref:Uncharacterized protein n=1 Tax=Cylicocyclus nassatus TaxID=53992 RepID=A0AA36MCC2_CYLNA|nr:unnamed protein product [Cylicocyclus nassatus]
MQKEPVIDVKKPINENVANVAANVSHGHATTETGGILNPIRRISDAFAKTIHVIQEDMHPHSHHNTTATISSEHAVPPTAEQQGGRRVSDIEHLWETSRKMNFNDEF